MRFAIIIVIVLLVVATFNFVSAQTDIDGSVLKGKVLSLDSNLVLNRYNGLRAAFGLPALRWSAALAQGALSSARKCVYYLPFFDKVKESAAYSTQFYEGFPSSGKPGSKGTLKSALDFMSGDFRRFKKAWTCGTTKCSAPKLLGVSSKVAKRPGMRTMARYVCGTRLSILSSEATEVGCAAVLCPSNDVVSKKHRYYYASLICRVSAKADLSQLPFPAASCPPKNV
jgi:hypothetical protein